VTERRNRKRSFKAEDVYRLRQVSDPQVSPGGHRVAYVVTSVDQEVDEYLSHIWVTALDGGEPEQVTRGPQKDSSPRWSPDGRTLAFVSNRKDKRNQVWLIGEIGEPWQLTDVVRGATNPAWSPDGKTILFQTKTRTDGETKQDDKKTPQEKNLPRVITELTYRFDGEGQYDDSFSHIWTIPSAGGKAKQITAGDFNDGQAAWSPDGKTIVFAANREAHSGEFPQQRDIWTVPARGPAGGRELRKLTPSKGPSSLPTWSPDGKTIAFTGHQRGEGFSSATSHLWVVPSDGSDKPHALTEKLDRSVLGIPAGQAIAWTPGSREIVFLGQDGGAVRVYRVPAVGGEAVAVTDPERWASAISLTNAGSAVISAISPVNPGELYALLLVGGEPKQLTHHNDEFLAAVNLCKPEPFTFKGADGWDIPGLIIKPSDFKPGQKYPLVLDIHGGPHGAHGQTFSPGFQQHAAEGYAVLLVNPRGSAGYGEPFTHACVGDWGGNDYEDLMRGVDWAIEQGIADPERLLVTGYSYGGFMTSWVVGHTNRFRAAVCGAPVSDLVSFYGESDIGTTFGQFEHGGPVWERWDEYRARSPLFHIKNCRTPFMLLHWEGDLRCPIGQSEELFAVLKKLGREVVFLRYPGAFHTYVTHAPSQRVDAITRTGEWFDRWLSEGAKTAPKQKQMAGAAAGN